MITIICGTNRENSGTEKVASYILHLLQEHYAGQVHLISLTDLSNDMLHPGMYEKDGQAAQIVEHQDKYVLPAEKFWFVFPEYNGGFPGILKLYLDALSVRKYKESFKGKKACLTGISSGRAGNLRGMEHLTGVLNHLGTVVMPNRLPISSIEKILIGKAVINNPDTRKELEKQVLEFVDF